MSPRLHVLLGAGGVGKTTLAASYALALSASVGRRVGLLGIDPSRRLKDALGVTLADDASDVPGPGALRAAILDPAESVRRWAAEASKEPGAEARLQVNPFFRALADRLATATDIFAAARVAEWAERDPALTDLVVDTAPGLNAIEFLTRPERVSAFLGGRLVGWLRWLARPDASGSSADRLHGARRIVWGLVRIGGSRLLGDLAEFFSLAEPMLARMLARVETTRRWLRDESTEILLVTSVSEDAALTVRELAKALASVGFAPRAVVVNRGLPGRLAPYGAELERIAARDPSAQPVVRYALAYDALETQVAQSVRGVAPRTLLVPQARGLDHDGRLALLAALGASLRSGLA